MAKCLYQKNICLTGAAWGLGAALAKRFAYEGANLILIDKDTAALESIDDELKGFDVSVTLVPLDLRKFGAFDELAAALSNRFGCLDGLVGNAAILGDLTPLTHQTFDQWQEIIDVNLTANWQMLKSLDPLLRKSCAGRAVFVTADIARVNKAYWGAYGVSKAALEKMIFTYAQEIQKTTLKVNLVDPGDLGTRLYAQAMPGINLHGVTPPASITDLFVKLLSSDCGVSGQVLKAQGQKDLEEAA